MVCFHRLGGSLLNWARRFDAVRDLSGPSPGPCRVRPDRSAPDRHQNHASLPSELIPPTKAERACPSPPADPTTLTERVRFGGLVICGHIPATTGCRLPAPGLRFGVRTQS